ncbi:MAG: hypothetical protein GDA47_00790 [Rhodospirillales bacterium]|nr:hypothetical protein [Rhodospirillales bacterium]
MPEFWKSAGFHLTEQTQAGWLAVSPDLIRAYLARPEIHPIEESCPAEHRLFESLMENPKRPVEAAELKAIADRDTADNYRVVLAWRDLLLSAGSLEAAYLELFTAGRPIAIPPVFIDQLVHLLLRGLLDGSDDPWRARAAELFFREQTVSTDGGQMLLADREIVEMRSKTGGYGGLGALVKEAGTPLHEVSLDVMTEATAGNYWERSDRFDMALDFRFTEAGQDAFARVLELWLRHLLGLWVRIQPLQSIRDERWRWHVGLDAESTRLLNALYQGEAPPDEELQRLLALFRLEFRERNAVPAELRGRPVYLGLAMGTDRSLRMKPQNLLTNLPMAKKE